MSRKSANMLKITHTVIIDGQPRKIKGITRDGATVVIELDNGDVIRRSSGSKLEVK
mgnify:CR=1 FL=1